MAGKIAVHQMIYWGQPRQMAWRKFYDTYKHDGSPVAIEAIMRMRALYVIEREIRGQQPEERRIMRQQLAGPLLEDLHAWLTHTLHTVSMKSALAEAIQ